MTALWGGTVSGPIWKRIAFYGAVLAAGASAAEIEALRARMAAFAVQYANPLYRLPMTFSEIFPVGVLVSVISAALLRNSRFLSARKV